MVSALVVRTSSGKGAAPAAILLSLIAMADSTGAGRGGAGGVGGERRAPKVDTSRKFHKQTIKGHEFVVDSRYKNLQYVGGGAYGLVCAADDLVRRRGGAAARAATRRRQLRVHLLRGVPP